MYKRNGLFLQEQWHSQDLGLHVLISSLCVHKPTEARSVRSPRAGLVMSHLTWFLGHGLGGFSTGPPTSLVLDFSEPPNHDDLPDTDSLIPGDPVHHSPIQNLDPPLRTDSSNGPPPTPRSFSGARIKVPNYSPSRRPLGGVSFGPLPSPGKHDG
jgi:hypothetical protein